MNWMPIGSPASFQYNGTDIAGLPAIVSPVRGVEQCRTVAHRACQRMDALQAGPPDAVLRTRRGSGAGRFKPKEAAPRGWNPNGSPPSLALAAGTYPAATATADPPEEPPGERPKSHGLRVAP